VSQTFECQGAAVDALDHDAYARGERYRDRTARLNASAAPTVSVSGIGRQQPVTVTRDPPRVRRE
jgi:hypothetical protein